VTTARRQPALHLATTSAIGLAVAIDVFLSQPDLAATTRAKYRQTLTVVEDELGDAPVTRAGLAGVVAQRWHHASPATWNRHVATVRSFAAYCARTRILEIAASVRVTCGAISISGIGGALEDRLAPHLAALPHSPHDAASSDGGSTRLVAATAQGLRYRARLLRGHVPDEGAQAFLSGADMSNVR
jgi:hypothetical protein